MKTFAIILSFSVLAWGSLSSAYTYAGKMNGVAGVLTLIQVGQTYTASFKGNNGQNGLLRGCNSTINQVLKMKQKNGVLKQLVFDFDPNMCFSVEGRTVTMDFKNNKVYLSILSHSEEYYPPCVPPGVGGPSCPVFPEYRPVFFEGKLTAQ